ncbi:MAG TPA: HAD family phosphatase [Planctomycetota bacterium]|nr:HAD family phosphatase [Planctomycetota bacterium]
MKLRAALFDLDGTLVDSEPLHRRAIQDTLTQLGADVAALEPRDFVGLAEREFWIVAKDRFRLAAPLPELLERKEVRYAELARVELRSMPGASACLERFRAAGLPLAIASGSTPRSIAVSVAVVGLGRFFRALVSSLDPEVEEGKPSPAVFLAAARRLGIDPAAALVVEDTEFGVEAGKAAGMFVVAIPNAWTRDHDFSAADVVLRSLDELEPW